MGNMVQCCKNQDKSQVDREEMLANAQQDNDNGENKKFEDEGEDVNNYNQNEDPSKQYQEDNFNANGHFLYQDDQNKNASFNPAENSNNNFRGYANNQYENPDDQFRNASHNYNQNYNEEPNDNEDYNQNQNNKEEEEEQRPEYNQYENNDNQDDDNNPLKRDLAASESRGPNFEAKEQLDEEALKELLSKLNNRNKAEDDPEFDNNGWKKFYPPEENFFEFNHGETFPNQVKVYNQDNLDLCEVYQGETNKRGERHGFGILTTSESIKRGGFRNGKFTGWGRESKNGEVIEAKFEDGVVNGKGVFKNKRGNVYTGDFVRGKREGYGTLVTNKFHYEGEFKDDKLNGNGKIKFLQQGHEYSGEFKDNEISGYGTFRWKNGDSYEGEMKNGRMNGHGKYFYEDGQVYEGEYVDGHKQGKGKLTYPNGKVYDGEFHRGLPDGKGNFTKDGKTSVVEFSKGKFKKSYNASVEPVSRSALAKN